MKSVPSETLELPLKPPELTRDIAIDSTMWQIAGRLRENKVSFFFGAGMSSPPPSNVPSAAALGEEIVKQLFPEQLEEIDGRKLASAFPLEILAEAFEMHGIGKRAGLDELLRKQTTDPESKPHDGHKALVGLAPYLTRIYTTNFDTLLEQAFGEGCVSAAAAEDLGKIADAARDKIPAILHLHGVVPSPFFITESELLKLDIPFLHFLNSDLVQDTFVFVGYSLTDPDFRPVYFEIMKTIRENRDLDKKTYMVSKVDPGLERELAEKCWSARAFDLIPMDASEFMQALRVAVRYSAHRAEFEQVAKRMHGDAGDPRTLANDIKAVTSRLADMEGEDVLECLEELTRKGVA